jgi:hypothetical protein
MIWGYPKIDLFRLLKVGLSTHISSTYWGMGCHDGHEKYHGIPLLKGMDDHKP